MTASQSNHNSSRSSSNSNRTGCHKDTDVNAGTICTTSCAIDGWIMDGLGLRD